MKKLKKINNWRIKPEVIKEKSPNKLFFESLNENIDNFSNINQAIGMVVEIGERPLSSLLNAYATFGVWLAKNDLIELNFKDSEEIINLPGYI